MIVNRIVSFVVVIAMMSGLTACEAQSQQSASPGMQLVHNATASGLPTVAEFGAATCSSCKDMKIVLDRVAQRTQGKAHVLIIDISKDWEARNAYGIQYMPTQVFFDASGREIGRHIGKLSEAEVMTALGLGA